VSEELYVCSCGQFYESHHPECPARRQYEVLQTDLAAANKSRDREAAAYDKLNEAFIDLNLDLAAVREELARAKAEIMQLWVCQAVKAKTTHNDAVIYAEARYEKEIINGGM
jgi:hypothetical protein